METHQHPHLWTRIPAEPEDLETPVMRYLDLARFLFLLEHKAIFCPAAIQFDDPFEGARSEGDTWEGRSDFNSVIRQHSRRCTYVSCWYLGTRESVAMWQLYGGGSSPSVAVQTTFSKLKRLFEPKDFSVGLVGYVDFEIDRTDTGIISWQYFFKRGEYAHEKEVRAIKVGDLTGEGHLPPGILVPVSLSRFINKIIVAPKAQQWFVELLQRICIRYKLRIPIVESKLDTKPRF